MQLCYGERMYQLQTSSPGSQAISWWTACTEVNRSSCCARWWQTPPATALLPFLSFSQNSLPVLSALVLVFIFFFLDLFLLYVYNYFCCMYTVHHMHALCPQRSDEGVLDSRELKLTDSCEVLGFKPGSSGRATGALNLSHLSRPCIFFFIVLFLPQLLSLFLTHV